MQGAPIQFAIAIAFGGVAAQVTVELLDDPALPPDEQARLAQAYAADLPWNTAMSRSVAFDYQLQAGLIKEAQQDKTLTLSNSKNSLKESWIRLTLHENTTLNEMAAYDRVIRRQLGGPYSAIDFKAVNHYPSQDGPRSGIANLLAPNFGGRFFLDSFGNEWPELLQAPYAQTAVDRLLRTGFALRHFYDDQHVLPAKLDDLVPQYLPAVPLDPFDDKPLRYDATRGLVYSVGISLKDSGGSKYVGETLDADPNINKGPISNLRQPTLELNFQNPPAPATP
jgi:hypothetical protein